MDNKTEYFTLKEDGVIGWIENMPEKDSFIKAHGITGDFEVFHSDQYSAALQSAISNAIEVSNQIEVGFAIQSQIAASSGISTSGPLEIGKVYQLKCRIELDPIGSQSPKRVALVTFSEPEEKWVCDECKFTRHPHEHRCLAPEKCQCEHCLEVKAFAKRISAGVEETQEGMISVFVLDMHGSKVYDTLKSNLLGMIECEIENLERGEFEELDINITRIQMTQAEYENLPEFSGY